MPAFCENYLFRKKKPDKNPASSAIRAINGLLKEDIQMSLNGS